ncbi:hypothetical protein [Kitasatospora aureofaciens]|uniref:hypothetical protein n=1 Tax=Kitasatospora aureofaciens TaxID=1894 RepID=UPI001C48DB2C|nr:hypothetical protein [Kitasatospora aureofaciens]MBV6703154.1 hypothetical protein [Kitasatospora aureofaciens]
MGKEQKTFEYPGELKDAQRTLMAVQTERRAFLATLPSWSGDLGAARQGLSEEQLAESARLEDAERRASHAVWADEYWATLSGEDRTTARSRLHHVDDPAEEAAA